MRLMTCECGEKSFNFEYIGYDKVKCSCGRIYKKCQYCSNDWVLENKEAICNYCNCKVNIQGYCYKPTPIFYSMKKEKTDLFAGIELEINFNNINLLSDFIHKYKRHEFCYLKHDGSLKEYGVEIVTHPATFSYHLKNNFWKDIFESLKYTNTENCGLHFHLNNKYFKLEEVELLDKLINCNTYITTQIGSRALKGYCKAVKVSNFYGYLRLHKNHTDACNLLNSNTIELRFCKSTNNYHSFIKKLKMIYVLVMFVKNVYKHNYSHLILDSQYEKQLYKAFDYFKGEMLSRI